MFDIESRYVGTTAAMVMIDDKGMETTCSAYFASQFNAFVQERNNNNNKQKKTYPNILDRPVGQTISTSVHTSVVTGPSFQDWEALRQAYIDATSHPPPFADIFTPNFEQDVWYGYFGAQNDFDRVIQVMGEDSKQAVYTDGKSNKFYYLGETTWRTVFQSSPAEPSASAGYVLDTTGKTSTLQQPSVSLGGWCDPVPTQVLAAMGCDRVILSNNPAVFGPFGLGVFRLLGGTDSEEFDIYSGDNPSSGFNVALEITAASVCADVFGEDAGSFADFGVEGLKTAPTFNRASNNNRRNTNHQTANPQL
jgi:hypothetical protein